MKHSYVLTRTIALLLALVMLLSFAACGDRTPQPSDDGSSSSDVSDSSSGLPAFINPLPEVDLGAINEPELPTPDLLEKINTAYNQNNDVVGWLNIPNTTIDNEVLHTTDNDYYLRRDITKAYNWYGCYYADYECTFGDRNAMAKDTIIYGHSMDDNPEGLKFSQLKKFLDIDFAKNNPYIYLSTPEDNMAWKVFAVFYTDTNLSYINPHVKGADFLNLVNEAKERSQFNYDVDVNATDKLLTLSTCTYVYGSREDQRFVIMARLVRPGEKIEATVDVEKNPNPKAPQFK